MSEYRSVHQIRPPDINERNWLVYLARRDGERFQSIADRFGISHTRVKQILERVEHHLKNPTTKIAVEPVRPQVPTLPRCIATTKRGDQCQAFASEWSGLCWNHEFFKMNGRWPNAKDARSETSNGIGNV